MFKGSKETKVSATANNTGNGSGRFIDGRMGPLELTRAAFAIA